jgi:hypothetical protein
MNDYEKTKTQLVQEITELRKRCATLEISAGVLNQFEEDTMDARKYAESVVETVREPLVVLSQI